MNIHPLLAARPDVVANLRRMERATDALTTGKKSELSLAVTRSGIKPDALRQGLDHLRKELAKIAGQGTDPAAERIMEKAAAADDFLAALTAGGPSTEHFQAWMDTNGQLGSALSPGVSTDAPVYKALGSDYVALKSYRELAAAHRVAEALQGTSAEGLLDSAQIKEAMDLLAERANAVTSAIEEVLFADKPVSELSPNSDIFVIAPELRGLSMKELMVRASELIRSGSETGKKLGGEHLLEELDTGSATRFVDRWRRKTDEPINLLISGLVEAR